MFFNNGIGKKIVLHGTSELKAAFKQIPDAVLKRLTGKVLRSLAKQIQEQAKGSTLFKDDEGDLRESIKVTNMNKSPDGYGLEVRAGNNNAFYAHMVHDGHLTRDGKSHVPAKPFLQVPFEVNKERMTNEIINMFYEEVEKAMSKLKKM